MKKLILLLALIAIGCDAPVTEGHGFGLVEKEMRLLLQVHQKQQMYIINLWMLIMKGIWKL